MTMVLFWKPSEDLHQSIMFSDIKIKGDFCYEKSFISFTR